MGQCVESFRVHASLACIAELLKKRKNKKKQPKNKTENQKLKQVRGF